MNRYKGKLTYPVKSEMNQRPIVTSWLMGVSLFEREKETKLQ